MSTFFYLIFNTVPFREIVYFPAIDKIIQLHFILENLNYHI